MLNVRRPSPPRPARPIPAPRTVFFRPAPKSQPSCTVFFAPHPKNPPSCVLNLSRVPTDAASTDPARPAFLAPSSPPDPIWIKHARTSASSPSQPTGALPRCCPPPLRTTPGSRSIFAVDGRLSPRLRHCHRTRAPHLEDVRSQQCMGAAATSCRLLGRFVLASVDLNWEGSTQSSRALYGMRYM